MLRKNILYALLILLPFYLSAQVISPPSSLPNLPNLAVDPVPFEQLITSEAKSAMGMINVYTVKDRYYFEIKDSILDRPILVLNRIVQSSAAVDKSKEGYAGEEMGENTIMFRKGNGKKIFMTSYITNDRSLDSTENGLKRELDLNNTPGILMSFDAKAYGAKKNSTLIDVTDFLSGNSRIISGATFNEKGFQSDKSYVDKIQSFPINTEIQGYKTYGIGSKDSTMTVVLNTSFLLLPKKAMRERYNDPRVGYFTPFNFDYDKNPKFASMALKISRWRLEPKPEDIEKYNRGELVEPIKPIIFYIDPATPKRWVPYLIAGVNDWQVAFEKAGFKNAIKAIEVPQDDTNWNMNDARYSVIVYKPSLDANAMGPSVMDVRSGEIIASHVSWYHNVMTLLHDWYLLQAGTLDKNAQRQEFSDELMGQLIRFVSSHEIGHTLGLAHNFGSSSTVPVEKLRDKKWVEENGHTPSIMDYARFNYVAQPEDNISQKGIFPRIGDYDKWAIEWGYRAYPDIKDKREETKMLFNKITDTLKVNPRLYFGSQEIFGITDPRRQNEDLSDNVMVANSYGIKNLKRILPNLPEWSKMPTDQFGERSGNGLKRSYSALLSQLSLYHSHVVNTIGKGYSTYTAVGDTTKVFTVVPKSKQREAMAYLNKQVFREEPIWLQPDTVLDQVWMPTKGKLTQNIAGNILRDVLDMQKMMNLESAALLYGDKTYTPQDLFKDLDYGIWPELSAGTAVSSYHIALQQQYISSLLIAVTTPAVNNIPLSGVIREQLMSLKNRIKLALPKIKDAETKYHYNDVLLQIASVEGESLN
ncbi:zinc-dependent metalloprotease [Flavobacterium sp. GSB-24]|uniref:zinc-dependent metalloprotease n=1 Tax=Flavobacterium sp. GSB-24 TaxID=2994319 RepID=UPI002491932F|nr:zinc-dependent metalloprotease [Flavobacterium sp. GSB-24]BDU25151.1 glutaminyl-tRNA synthetase [Flavobacterium sp. GSB-24]